MIKFQINDKEVIASEGDTILTTAQKNGIAIPHLCYKKGYRPDGNCRSCMVEIDGEPGLAPSCHRTPEVGMVVRSTSERAIQSQKLVLEMLRGDMPEQGDSPYLKDSKLDKWCSFHGIDKSRFHSRKKVAADISHPAIDVNLDACIQCNLCVRACREEQANDVIGYAYRGAESKIVFDMDIDLKSSTCVACGECVQACPTGALSSKHSNNMAGDKQLKKVDTLCPYCGVGCQVTYKVKDNRIVGAEGRNGPANRGRLCVKGRYGYDYAQNKQRLTVPLIRMPGAVKNAEKLTPDTLKEQFREATWEEALDFAATGLSNILRRNGEDSLAGFGSAKGSNEEAYLFQKLVRTGFRNNNVDHCTRLCHASSVSALLQSIGSGAVSNPFTDVSDADVIVLIGANPTSNHPVASSFFKNAIKSGKTLIEINPMKTNLSRFAKHHIQFRSETDVAFLNGLMNVIIEENLHNEDFIAKHTNHFEKLKDTLKKYTPEKISSVCGIPADTIREVARCYATANNAIILWGMGVSQHIHGTDNARCLINLALITGNIGRPGTGLHPLRGQNNVQGASDVGLIPMFYPDYQSVKNSDVQSTFEKVWGTELSNQPGLTVIEVVDKIFEDQIKGMYIMGENPAMSDPNLNHSREGLAKLDHLVVQDIFYTETAALADVILPASSFMEKDGSFTNSNRQVQRARQVLQLPGDARQDWEIIHELANRIGLDWDYQSVADVFAEMTQVMPSIKGISWERLDIENSVTYPCDSADDKGQPIIFADGFPTEDGRGNIMPAEYKLSDEIPDAQYPMIFITGRVLEHWHTGSMTRKSVVLDEIQPEAFVYMHEDDMTKLGIKDKSMVKLASRRGELSTTAIQSNNLQPGSVFMPFCFAEAAANVLTKQTLDPEGKIPGFKFCSVSISSL